MESLPLPTTLKVSKMQGEEQTLPSEPRGQAQEEVRARGRWRHLADGQTEAQEGKGVPRGGGAGVLPTPSPCLDPTPASHLGPLPTSSAGSALPGR